MADAAPEMTDGEAIRIARLTLFNTGVIQLNIGHRSEEPKMVPCHAGLNNQQRMDAPRIAEAYNVLAKLHKRFSN